MKERRPRFTATVAWTILLLCRCPTTAFVAPSRASSQLQIQQSPSASERLSVLLFSSASEDSDDNCVSSQQNQRTLGISVLLTVPLAWGTYTPVVKYLYAIQPPVPGLVFSAAYYVVAAVSLWFLVSLSSIDDSSSAAAAEPSAATTVQSDLPKAETVGNGTIINFSSRMPVQGGLELGLYLFAANILQVIGLKTVSADRAGFLVQLTTVMVPLMEATLAGNLRAVSTRTWTACMLAFTGVVVIDLDGREFDATVSSLLQTAFGSFTVGDSLVVLAAVFYSVHVVRLERYARETTALKLATTKAAVEAFLSVGLVVALMTLFSGEETTGLGLASYANHACREITSFFSTIPDSLSSGAIPKSLLVQAVGAILWTGWVTCAYTIYAQSFGQSRVKPTDANLIYTVQPLFTALFAFLLLGETMGPAGVAGGSLILIAVYMVAVNQEGGGVWKDEHGDATGGKQISDQRLDVIEVNVVAREEVETC